MALKLPSGWQKKINTRVKEKSLRELKSVKGMVDFYSNDYLGIARGNEVTEVCKHIVSNFESLPSGGAASRLLGGNHIWVQRCETYLSNFYNSPNAVLFQSGYSANIGLMACIADRHDTIIYDEYVHASIRDGIRLSLAKSYSFKHNNIVDLKKKIKRAQGTVFIVVESIYSMDGDASSIAEIIEAARENKAYVIVDEAHAVGVMGDQGRGLLHMLGLQDDVFLQVVTFGKGLGVHGAAVLCSDKSKEYITNFCRSFIYTTSPSPKSCVEIMAAHEIIKAKDTERADLQENVEYFRNQMQLSKYKLIEGSSAICGIKIPGVKEVKKIAEKIQKSNIGVLPVLSPTVPEGSERLRIILHSFNTRKEIDALLKALK